MIYTLLFYRLIKVSQMIYDNFGVILVLGTMISLFFQTFINIGMSIGLVPVVGVPLPFLSYGGSSLLVSIILIALVESVIMYQPFTKYEDMLKL